MTASYTLMYNPLHSFQSDQEETATAHDLDGLVALIREHVIPDDYGWITTNENGVETGKGQYYRSEQAGILLEPIEEHDAARELYTRVNGRVARPA